jgi:ABC-2 type transport system ATP-binding protein
MLAVSLREVSKKYRIFPSGRDRLKEALSFGRKERGHDFWALRDVNLEVRSGTSLGIIGRNGAGKSTLLNIVAGILQPTSGTVEVNGRLVALSGLGAGFNPEFTGRENVMMNGLLLGIERQEMLEHFDDIAAFADVGEFMDQPIKTYSSGMRSRLGFAVAINVKPDILILDETLAAGDAVFKQLALQKMYELRDSGTTVFFVSHSTKTVEEFCTEALLLHEGRVMATGETTEVIEKYQALVEGIRQAKKRKRMDGGQPPDQAVVVEKPREGPTFTEDPAFDRWAEHVRSGTGEARIRKVEVLDRQLRPVKTVTSGSTVTVRVYLEYLRAVKDSELLITLCEEVTRAELRRREMTSQFCGPNLGYVLELYERYRENPESVDEQSREFFKNWSPPRAEANGHAPVVAGELFSASTTLEEIALKDMDKGERVLADFTFKIPLRKGRYSITAAARAGGGDSYLDRVERAIFFRIKNPQKVKRPRSQGLLRLPTASKVHVVEGAQQNHPL